uniref:Uncharacterized protein n=1 Tax=Acrobeloides nanus TaxID=290746 RepID=A0A914DJB1_9BILA
MGLRFYLHIPRDLPHLVGDGISVAPGGIIYSSITPIQYTLLAKHKWGDCIESWPKGISLDGVYSSARCQAFCRATYFTNKCGCSPFVYDLNEKFTRCTPYKLYECIKDEPIDSLEEALKCDQCSIECDRWTYSTSNSYDFGYSPGAYEWFNDRSPNWTEEYVKNNFVALNIYYKELTYSYFEQLQGSDLVVLFSNIGGNMGMFVGMSLLSCTEVIIFLSKISWILFSKKRRNYLKQKKDQEKEREQKLEEALKNIKLEAAKAAEENEAKLEQTLKNIKDLALASKQAEEARKEQEKSSWR